MYQGFESLKITTTEPTEFRVSGRYWDWATGTLAILIICAILVSGYKLLQFVFVFIFGKDKLVKDAKIFGFENYTSHLRNLLLKDKEDDENQGLANSMKSLKLGK